MLQHINADGKIKGFFIIKIQQICYFKRDAPLLNFFIKVVLRVFQIIRFNIYGLHGYLGKAMEDKPVILPKASPRLHYIPITLAIELRTVLPTKLPYIPAARETQI